MLLKKNGRGGKEELPWTGPVTVVASTKDGTDYQIRNGKGAVLCSKYQYGGQLKIAVNKVPNKPNVS